MRARHPRLTVLYDADCGVCRGTAQALMHLDWRRRLELLSLQEFRGTTGSPGRDELLASLHVRDERGRWFAGGDAALRIARVIPVLTPLGLAGRLPFGAALAAAAYRLVAEHRHEISRALGLDSCFVAMGSQTASRAASRPPSDRIG